MFSRHVVSALLAAGLVPVAPCSADLTQFLVDYSLFDGSLPPIADGRLDPNEYGRGNSQHAAGSGLHTGLGGALGGAGTRLYHSQSFRGLHLAFRPGAGMNGTVVLFFDVVDGGRTAGSGPGLRDLGDTAGETDRSRRALAALRGVYPSEFGEGGIGGGGGYQFTADAAITFNADGASVWRVPDAQSSTFTHVASGVAPNGGGGAAGIFECLLPSAEFNGWRTTFFSAYIGDDGLLADEAIPAQPFSDGGNPGIQPGAEFPAPFDHFGLITTYIPAPGAITVFAAAAALAARRRR